MAREPKYKITRVSPNPNRWELGEIPLEGHKIAWNARRNLLARNGKNMSYQACCLCRWKDVTDEGEPYWVPKRVLIGRHTRHIMHEMDKIRDAKQGRLDGV